VFAEADLSNREFNTFLLCRGAILACTIPWIKSLLLTHSSGIMSQESSLLALNTMYQVRQCLFLLYGCACHGGSVRDTDQKTL